MFDQLTAAQAMSKPAITLDQRETVAMAWELLRGQPFGHLVIVNGDSTTGIIDARQLVAATKSGETISKLMRPLVEILYERTLCVTPDASLSKTIEVMAKQHYDAIPVVSATGRPLGIITSTDILQILAQHLSKTTPATISNNEISSSS